MYKVHKYKSKTLRLLSSKVPTKIQPFNLDEFMDMIYQQKRLTFNLLVTSAFLNGILLTVLIRILSH